MDKKRLTIISLLSLALITSAVIATSYNEKVKNLDTDKSQSENDKNAFATDNSFCETEDVNQLLVGCNSFF